MTLEEFVTYACTQRIDVKGLIPLDTMQLKKEAKFWLTAFVRLVRERAEKIHQERPSSLSVAAAFNEIVNELGLEEK